MCWNKDLSEVNDKENSKYLLKVGKVYLTFLSVNDPVSSQKQNLWALFDIKSISQISFNIDINLDCLLPSNLKKVITSRYERKRFVKYKLLYMFDNIIEKKDIDITNN